MTDPSTDPWKLFGTTPITAAGRWNSGLRAPSCIFTSPILPGEPDTHLRLLAHAHGAGLDQHEGQKEVRCCKRLGNLIGGHSCINRGIEEFLSAWWNWLCMNGPSLPPQNGPFSTCLNEYDNLSSTMSGTAELQQQLKVESFSWAGKFSLSLSGCLY